MSSADASEALLDSDGDGQSKLAEYRSGTSPTNAASCLKLEPLIHANGHIGSGRRVFSGNRAATGR